MTEGDITNWLNSTTGSFNENGLIDNMAHKAGMFYGIGPYALAARTC